MFLRELLDKLGGTYEVRYGEPAPPGTPPEQLKQITESLFPGLYAGSPGQSSNISD